MSGRNGAGAPIHVETDGFAGPVHVREDGRRDAPALVLIHGFGGSMRWFDRAIPLLSGAFRLVRVDLLGHAATGGPAADAPLQARMVDAVLEQLGVTDVTAVGHSFGADVAVELAERSERVGHLVVVTQGPDYSDATLPRGRYLMTLPLVSTGLHRIAQPIAAAVSAIVGATRGHAVGPELAAQALRDFRALNTAMFRVVLVDRRDRMAARPLDVQVREAAKPTLVILGGRDHFYGARSAPRYGAAGARVEILHDAGHSPFVEMPARVAALIHTFAAAER